MKIEIPDLRIQELSVDIVGVEPLIMSRFSEARIAQMQKAQSGAPRAKKAPRNPQQDYQDSLYLLPESTPKKPRYGFPSVAFTLAMIAACRHVDGITMTLAKGCFHMKHRLVEIHGTPQMRTDHVRNATGVADLRYRAEFPAWSATLHLRHLPTLTPAQIVNLINVAGFAVGVGEFRPELSGHEYGQFRVAVSE